MFRKIKQSIDLGDRDALRSIGHLEDRVSRADLAFLDHAEVEPRPLMRNEQRGHLRIAHPYADAIASDPRLRHFEQRVANSIAIANADFVIGEAIDGQVFSKLTVLEVLPIKVVFPVSVGFELIHHHRPVLSTMSSEVPLSVSIDIEAARHHPSGHRPLPDSGVNYPALPLDVAW